MPEVTAASLVALTRALRPGGPHDDMRQAQPSVALARRNLVLVRLASALAQSGGDGEWASLHAAAELERVRVARTVELIDRIGGVCERAGLAHVFVKAFQHYPDMGHDIDLLVGGSAREADRVLAQALRARRTPPGAFDRISGKTGLWHDSWPSPIEVHHGRLGQAGEQIGLAAGLLDSRRHVTIAGIRAWVPTAEHEMLIQAYQRVCCHKSLRVSDVLKGAAGLADDRIDTPGLTEQARQWGLDRALQVYLAYVRRILDASPGAAVVAIHNGQYVVAVGDVVSAYVTEVRRLVARGEWGGLARLAMAPVALTVSRVLPGRAH